MRRFSPSRTAIAAFDFFQGVDDPEVIPPPDMACGFARPTTSAVAVRSAARSRDTLELDLAQLGVATTSVRALSFFIGRPAGGRQRGRGNLANCGFAREVPHEPFRLNSENNLSHAKPRRTRKYSRTEPAVFLCGTQGNQEGRIGDWHFVPCFLSFHIKTGSVVPIRPFATFSASREPSELLN